MKRNHHHLLTTCEIVSVAVFIFIQNGIAHMVGNDQYHRIETLDNGKGKFQLEWKVDWNSKRVTFNVSAETKGYVGFGLSGKGKMTGADIVIGGVKSDGTSYFSDYHAVANQMPEQDPSQDWTLHSAKENLTHTFLSFSRVFDTCDPQDYPITENKISLIWAYGERDYPVAYHYRDRGEYPVYLLHPDYTPSNVESLVESAKETRVANSLNNLKVWTLYSRLEISSDDTTYWCTMHKAPKLTQKHHIIGFGVRFPDEQSRRRVHHLDVHKCRAPMGRTATQMFDSYLSHRGQQCFNLREPLGPLPTEYCTEFYTVWGVGGRPYFFPPHVGFPLGESEDEYYLYQVHYDNPDNLSGVVVDVSLDYYYTSDLRAHDGGMIEMRHRTPGLSPSILVPPSSLDHIIYGMCGKGCTKELLPPEGIHIFGLLPHSHNAGVAMTFQHFRGNEELPWIQSDNNYAFDFQQTRVVNQEARIMPEDLLVFRCTYDSTRANGTVVGGFKSQQEMCAAFVYYYNKIPNYSECSSEIQSEKARQRFLGIENVTWSNREVEYVVVTPDELAGLRVSQVSDNRVHWNVERREQLQRFQLSEPHVNMCPPDLEFPSGSNWYQSQSTRRQVNDKNTRKVEYPYDATPYRPDQSCSFQ